MKARKERKNVLAAQEQFIVEPSDAVHAESQQQLLSEQTEHKTQAYRAGAYELLAALLRAPPTQTVLDYIASIGGEESEGSESVGSELKVSLSMLSLAASSCDVSLIDDEYHLLFIGLGRGELMPYGSWYQTGFLMEKPLGILRSDLKLMGFARQSEIHEPEDHIAALFEVMALMIHQKTEATLASNLERQQQFFDTHIGCWAATFFDDLSRSPAAVFYRSVGRLGAAMVDFESQYLSMNV